DVVEDPVSNADAEKGEAATAIGTDSLYVDGAIDVEGYGPIKIPTNAQSMNIGQDGSITYVDVNGQLQFAGQLLLAKF
ncbi:flagellar basal body rod protein FlgG, partial [Bacillus amyloliquefaciens]